MANRRCLQLLTRPVAALLSSHHPLRQNNDDDDTEDDDVSNDDEVEYSSDDEEGNSLSKGGGSRREYTAEEMAEEAAGIGYKVVGPLEATNGGVFKPYEPIFAVVQIGSLQFKVSNGDSIFVERLKFCEVNDKLILNKVVLVGTSSSRCNSSCCCGRAYEYG